MHLGLKEKKGSERKAETRELEGEKQKKTQGSRRREACQGEGGISLRCLRCRQVVEEIECCI